MRLRGATTQQREHRGPLTFVGSDVQERINGQHPARAAGGRCLQRGMHERRSGRVTAGQRLTHRLHRCRLDTGALRAKLFEACGERRRAGRKKTGLELAGGNLSRIRERVSGHVHKCAVEGGRGCGRIVLPQAKGSKRAPRMGAHLPRIDVGVIFQRQLALELLHGRLFVAMGKPDQPEQEMQP